MLSLYKNTDDMYAMFGTKDDTARSDKELWDICAFATFFVKGFVEDVSPNTINNAETLAYRMSKLQHHSGELLFVLSSKEVEINTESILNVFNNLVCLIEPAKGYKCGDIYAKIAGEDDDCLIYVIKDFGNISVSKAGAQLINPDYNSRVIACNAGFNLVRWESGKVSRTDTEEKKADKEADNETGYDYFLIQKISSLYPMLSIPRIRESKADLLEQPGKHAFALRVPKKNSLAILDFAEITDGSAMLWEVMISDVFQKL